MKLHAKAAAPLLVAVAGAALAAGLFMVVPASASDSAANPTIAIVNGSKITKTEVMDALSAAPGKKLSDEEIKFIFPRAVEMLVNEKLVDQAVDASKIKDSAAYKKQLALVQDQMAKQMYLQKYLAGKITDKQVQAEYDDFKKANEGKLEVHAYQIVVPTKIEAEQVIKDLDAGKKFEDLARERSADAQSAQHGGDIGYFAKDELPDSFKAIADAAFSLKVGQYTKEPVKSDFGWHVIKVTDRRERKVPDISAVEMNIRQKLSQKALGEMVTDLRKKAKLQFFDMNGKPMTIKQVNDAAMKNPAALKAAADKAAADLKKGDKK